MAEHLLTKCPHCSTTFRLTQAQLDIAGGAVRCGACYQVFHAAEHIVKTSVVEEHRQITKEPDPVEEAFDVKSEEGMDPYDSSDIEALDKSNDDAFNEAYQESIDKESKLEDFGYKEKPKKADKNDESWAEELLKELGDDEEEPELIEDNNEEDSDEEDSPSIVSGDNAFSLDDEPKKTSKKKPAKGQELSDTFMNLGNFAGDDPFAISEIEEDEFGESDRESVDESWAKAMLDELEEDEKPKKPVKSELSILMDEEEEPVDNSPFASKELSKDKDEIKQRAKERSQKEKQLSKQSKKADALRTDETEDFFKLLEDDTKPSANEPDMNLDDLDQLNEDVELEDITPENLFADSDAVINQQIQLSELEYAKEEARSGVGKTLLMLIVSVILITGLGAQYVYFHFDQASRNPTIRPWAEKFCATVGCNLVSQSDVSQIIGTNLVVRSHPYEKNALVIDVIIKNRATFPQPYPQVQLSFEDINGNPVASRRFKPQEYIKDQQIDLNSMPSNVPIHLTLEIVDPGRDAVNYQLHFLPQDSAS